MLNYKGIYAGDKSNDKYICTKTGAHFEFFDLCKRLKNIPAKRAQFEKTLAILSTFEPV
jgi:hypothetical protein